MSHELPGDVLKTPEVAALFGVNEHTVANWCRSGEIPYFMTPKGWRRFRRSELDPYLKSRRARTPAGIE